MKITSKLLLFLIVILNLSACKKEINDNNCETDNFVLIHEKIDSSNLSYFPYSDLNTRNTFVDSISGNLLNLNIRQASVETSDSFYLACPDNLLDTTLFVYIGQLKNAMLASENLIFQIKRKVKHLDYDSVDSYDELVVLYPTHTGEYITLLSIPFQEDGTLDKESVNYHEKLVLNGIQYYDVFHNSVTIDSLKYEVYITKELGIIAFRQQWDDILWHLKR